MTITASKLRANIYRTLGRILRTGAPIKIKLKGEVLKIAPLSSKKGLGNLLIKKHNILNGNPEGIVHMDWSREWKG